MVKTKLTLHCYIYNDFFHIVINIENDHVLDYCGDMHESTFCDKYNKLHQINGINTSV